jgi:hypothetical protein
MAPTTLEARPDVAARVLGLAGGLALAASKERFTNTSEAWRNVP